MLGKLLKYEFRATRRVQLSILLGSFAASLLGGVLLFCLISPDVLSALESRNEGLYIIFSILGGMMTTVLYILAFSSAVLSLIMLLVRYYKNFFTDEGYLTFTLPVQPRTLLCSKLICSLVWLFGTLIAECFALFTLVFSTALADGEAEYVSIEISAVANEIMQELFGGFGISIENPSLYVGLLLVLIVVTLLVSALAQMLIYYLAITLGAIIAKKHKILAAVGMYFVINTAIGWIYGILSVFLTPLWFTGFTVDAYFLHFIFIGIILLMTVFAFLAFLWINKSLQKKLNLE